MGQVKDRVYKLEFKVEDLDHANKESENYLNYMEKQKNCRYHKRSIPPKLQI